MEVTTKDIMDLRTEGYSNQEIQKAMEEIEKQYGQPIKRPFAGQSTAFSYNPNDNLIKWQLELNDLLQKAEHILKQDIVEVKGNNVVWSPNPNPEDKIFSNKGVQSIMRILIFYVNRNTILSDYDPDEIREKVLDFGKELNDWIFSKYEEFFNFPSLKQCEEILLKRISERKENIRRIYKNFFNIDLDNEKLDDLNKVEENYQKIMVEIKRIKEEIMLSRRKDYPILVRGLVDIVHSVYKRALYGKERESLRTARNIQQQEQIMPSNINIATGEFKRERSIINPARYLMGRYK